MLLFLCNPFNDPNDPWYYVIGVIFLLLIFGALALYIILTNKKKKDGQAVDENAEQPIEADKAEEVAGTEQQTEAEQAEEPEPPQDSSDAEDNMQEEK